MRAQISTLDACDVAHIYFLATDPGAEPLRQLCAFLLVDPVVETAHIGPPETGAGVHVIQCRPAGTITDVTAF
ncbi:MAG: hypothetical protein R2851_15535 [Caldilineaceae bacterium]